MKPQARENYRPITWLFYMLHTYHLNKLFFFKIYYDISFQDKPSSTVGKGDTNTVSVAPT